MIKRCAIYVRVSTQNQSDQSQLHILRRYCQERGLPVYHEYSDTMTGSKDSRPALNALMDDARKRKFDLVLVFRFDRFARSTRFLLNALEEFKALKIDFISYSENVDTSSPLGTAVFAICAALSQLERDIIRSRVSAGLAAAKARGVAIGRKKKRDDDEILRLRKEGLSVRAIARQLKIAKGSVQKALKSAVPKTPSK